MSVRNIVGPTILLASGNYFDFKDPFGSTFHISDIAQGLSNTCRFGGHCDRFYSVAEHSVHCSHLVDDEHKLSALMHDAAEAFTGDMPKPLKSILPDFRQLEYFIEGAVMSRFDLPYPLHLSIKEIDKKMLKMEQTQAMRNNDIWPASDAVETPEITLQFWSPDEAFRRFIQRFFELGGAA